MVYCGMYPAPILFKVFISDLEEGTVSMFVKFDDSKLGASGCD